MSLNDLTKVLNEGDADDVSGLLEDIFQHVEENEQDESVQERIALLMTGLVPALVYQRENEEQYYDADDLEKHLSFKNVIRLSRDAELPETIQESLLEYLALTARYDDDNYDELGDPAEDYDPQPCEEQHDEVLQVLYSALED